jgi:hypothetical protein
MMQKQKLKACLLAIVGVACMSFSQNQLALQGTYTAPNGTEVYLINLDNRDTLSVVSAANKSIPLSSKSYQIKNRHHNIYN